VLFQNGQFTHTKELNNFHHLESLGLLPEKNLDRMLLWLASKIFLRDIPQAALYLSKILFGHSSFAIEV
jgi:hypothetical protein